MSLKGRIRCEDPDSIGGFEAFAMKLKQSIGEITGTSFGTNRKNPFGDLFLEGIVQGDIKLQAVNDWKTTTYYGFTDALKGVNMGGGAEASAIVATAKTNYSINGSSVLKFANTVMNVLGYTLGNTGPASKKMYGGSNLNGFSVQFKWYTPYMDGWKEAIRALCYLAWPTSSWNEDVNSTVSEKPLDASDSQKLAQEEEYKNIIYACNKHVSACSKMKVEISKMIDMANSENPVKWTEVQKLAAPFSGGNDGYTDLNEIYNTIQGAIGSQSVSKLEIAHSDANDSIDLDGTVMMSAKNRVNMQLRAGSIGSDINAVHWYDNDVNSIPVDPSATVLAGGGELPQVMKEEGIVENLPETKAIKLLASGATDLVKGLADSFARNPPKVCLEIFDSYGEMKYRFSPLVITSFGISSSRETVEGDPLILTIDISFDYYQVNATNAIQAPLQKFAGVQIFNNKEVRL